MTEITIRELDPTTLSNHLDDLSDILHATVHAGASVGFILPYPLSDSHAFWQDRVLPGVEKGVRQLFVASAQDRIIGTVQLDLDVFPNQAHRGEVMKLLVHPDFRRRGIAFNLMHQLETRARDLGKQLLTLDTRTGDSAEPLYHKLGYQTAGMIPGYCRAPEKDRYDSTTYMYKAL